MTGQQLLHDLRTQLENNLEALPHESADRETRIRDLEDRSLWSGRLRKSA